LPRTGAPLPGYLFAGVIEPAVGPELLDRTIFVGIGRCPSVGFLNDRRSSRRQITDAVVVRPALVRKPKMFRAISSFALASSRIFSSDTPAAVVIDEALELARR